MSRNRCNFTIIELLVSVAIIAILFSILMPAFSESQRKARFVRWLQFNKQCSNDSTCLINLNFQDGESDILRNTAQAYHAKGFNASDYTGIIKGDYEWGRGRWNKNKKAIIFDGMSTYIEFPKSKYVDFDGTGDFTIISWVKFNLPANDSANGIFSQSYINSKTTGYCLYFAEKAPEVNKKSKLATTYTANAKITFDNMDKDEKRYMTIHDESWFQVTMRNKVVNGIQEVHVFLNAVELSVRKTQYDKSKKSKCIARLALGCIRFQKRKKNVLAQEGKMRYFFKGKMDEFLVYSRALSDREIKNHYLMGAKHGN